MCVVAPFLLSRIKVLEGVTLDPSAGHIPSEKGSTSAPGQQWSHVDGSLLRGPGHVPGGKCRAGCFM